MTSEQEDRLTLELLRGACQSAKIDPLRLSVSVTCLVDLLDAVDRYLKRFDEAMIGAGKAKKEGLDTKGLVEKIQDLQTELHMYHILAMLRLGRQT